MRPSPTAPRFGGNLSPLPPLGTMPGGEGINGKPQAAPGHVSEWSETCQAVEAQSSRRGAKQRAPAAKRCCAPNSKIMRDIIVVLVQAITDLFDCLPKELYATDKVTRIEEKQAHVHSGLAERQRHWVTEDGVRGSVSQRSRRRPS